MKQTLLGASRATGVLTLFSNSRWRSRRLLILCYHSLAVDEEQLWRRPLFFTAAEFRRRMDILQGWGASVLLLGEGLQRLRAGTLPPRSVVLTFDDGTADFPSLVWPELKARGFPATVYVTSYYAEKQKPVFSLMVSYILWKARRLTLPEIPEVPQLEPHTGAPLQDEQLRDRLSEIVLSHAFHLNWSLSRRDEFLTRLSGLLDVDYAELLRKRVLRMMTPEEAAHLSVEGADLQLHTHRHRTPLRKDLFVREIQDNRRWLEQYCRPGTARHFCYPSGVLADPFPTWLRDNQIETAVTCVPGLVDQNANMLQLPRLVDTAGLGEIEFEAWLSGAAALLPRRPLHFSAGPDAMLASRNEGSQA